MGIQRIILHSETDCTGVRLDMIVSKETFWICLNAMNSVIKISMHSFSRIKQYGV